MLNFKYVGLYVMPWRVVHYFQLFVLITSSQIVPLLLIKMHIHKGLRSRNTIAPHAITYMTNVFVKRDNHLKP